MANLSDFRMTKLVSGTNIKTINNESLVGSGNMTISASPDWASPGTIGSTTPNTGAFTTLSASGVATFSAGTVSAPAITTTGDTNTGEYFPAADTIAWTAGGTERMRIDSSGNVGIGTSSPTDFGSAYRTLQVKGNMADAGGYILSTTADGAVTTQLASDATAAWIGTRTNHAVNFITNSSTKATILSSGNVGIGTSSPASKLEVNGAASATRFTSGYDSGDSNSFQCSNWFRSSGSSGWYNQSYAGGIYMQDSTWVRTYGGKYFYVDSYIACAGNITAYYSDERLKTKLGKIDNALEKVCSLEGFVYEENDLALSLMGDKRKGLKQVGISAQAVNKVLPEVVSLAPFDIETDEHQFGKTWSKSGEDYLTVDYARLVPLLIESIKELREEVKALKEK